MLETVLLMSLLAAENPKELGKVAWLRDLGAAAKTSRASGRPILILFDEVPGCSTVLGFGEGALSDPAIVALIETRFVPLAIYNNTAGADRKVLDAFGEPAWNNPVVRIIDADRRPLARFAGPYTAQAFRAVLETALASVPNVGTVTLAGACFWECEAQLGAIDGVIATRVGFLEGSEVVEVRFDPAKLTLESMVAAADRLGCAERIFTGSAAESMRFSAKDTKYYLARSRWAGLAMDETTASKVNSALRRGESPERFLPGSDRR